MTRQRFEGLRMELLRKEVNNMKRETKLLKTKCRNDVRLISELQRYITPGDLECPEILESKVEEIREKLNQIMQEWQTIYNCRLRYGATTAQMRYYEIIMREYNRANRAINIYKKWM